MVDISKAAMEYRDEEDMNVHLLRWEGLANSLCPMWLALR